jgi:hypothetical protein
VIPVTINLKEHGKFSIPIKTLLKPTGEFKKRGASPLSKFLPPPIIIGGD